MTSGEHARLHLTFEGEDAGTTIGTIAWVLGALQIMKDRGHAESDESFHDLLESVEPQLNRVAALIGGARAAIPPDDAVHEQIEAAYASVREAFETWIRLTASDTAGAAIGQRLASALDEIDLPDGAPNGDTAGQ